MEFPGYLPHLLKSAAEDTAWDTVFPIHSNVTKTKFPPLHMGPGSVEEEETEGW